MAADEVKAGRIVRARPSRRVVQRDGMLKQSLRTDERLMKRHDRMHGVFFMLAFLWPTYASCKHT
jgi:hypothetical protein